MDGAEHDNRRAIDVLWQEFKATGSRQARDGLIVHYAPMVNFVAGRVAVGLPPTIEQADLVSYGIFGLIDAIEKFDPGRNVKFETYAMTRVRGAIIDELRAVDWVPRTVRAKARALEKAFSTLEASLGRAPTDAELAEQLGVGEDELQAMLAQVSFVGIVPLDEVLGGDRDDGTTLGDTIADQGAGPVGAFEVEETRVLLASSIGRLGDREKTVLGLYYYENLTLAEIGQVLGVTESRVCQIHSRAVLQLRSRLHAADREPAAPKP